MQDPLRTSLERRAGALTGRPWFWIAVVGVLFAAPLVRGFTQPPPPAPPPVLGVFPEVAATDIEGLALAERLRGRAFVASVLCAACDESMRTLQHRTRNLGDALWLVSFPDPSRPAATFARSPGAGPRWRFASGSPPAILQIPGDPLSVVLVDAEARVRGRYRIGDSPEMSRLLRDSAMVAAAR